MRVIKLIIRRTVTPGHTQLIKTCYFCGGADGSVYDKTQTQTQQNIHPQLGLHLSNLLFSQVRTCKYAESERTEDPSTPRICLLSLHNAFAISENTLSHPHTNTQLAARGSTQV